MKRIAYRSSERKAALRRNWNAVVAAEQGQTGPSEIVSSTSTHFFTEETVRRAIEEARDCYRGPRSLEIGKLLKDLGKAFPGELVGDGVCPVVFSITRRLLLPFGVTFRVRIDGEQRFYRLAPIDRPPTRLMAAVREVAV